MNAQIEKLAGYKTGMRRGRKGQGTHTLYAFPNGYVGSVIHNLDWMLGADEWELAVKKDGFCVYNTPVTGDVVRCGTLDYLAEKLSQIRDLPKEQ